MENGKLINKSVGGNTFLISGSKIKASRNIESTFRQIITNDVKKIYLGSAAFRGKCIAENIYIKMNKSKCGSVPLE